VDEPKARSQVAQFVRIGRIETNVQSLAYPRLIFRKTQIDVIDVVGTILRFAAVCIKFPADVRIPPARFDEQVDPWGLASEIRHDHYYFLHGTASGVIDHHRIFYCYPRRGAVTTRIGFTFK
jgi:hypothetical protein